MAFLTPITLKFLEFQEPFFKKVLGGARGRASQRDAQSYLLSGKLSAKAVARASHLSL